MAGYDLIDRYLGALRARIRWRPEADEIIDELRDHLYSAMDDAAGDTSDETAEQRRLLERFGDEQQVATALATTPLGGVAVPTASTKSMGAVAMVAAGLWLVFPLASLIVAAAGDQQTLDGAVQVILIIVAGGLTVGVMAGLRERLGGLGRLATVGMVFAGLGAAAGLLFWFFAFWATLMAIGWLLFATAMMRVGIASRRATLAVGSAWIIGLGTFAVLRFLEFGTVDEWGDYPAAILGGLVTGSVIFAAGLGSLGRWMHNEEPVALDPVEPLLSA